jgi:hypothetical protein
MMRPKPHRLRQFSTLLRSAEVFICLNGAQIGENVADDGNLFLKDGFTRVMLRNIGLISFCTAGACDMLYPSTVLEIDSLVIRFAWKSSRKLAAE